MCRFLHATLNKSAHRGVIHLVRHGNWGGVQSMGSGIAQTFGAAAPLGYAPGGPATLEGRARLSSAAPIVVDVPSGIRDADGSVVENVYCLACGYNLRGLYGDPVRCPECGRDNGLGLAAIPARVIYQALVRLETSPTMCCAMAIMAACLLPWLVTGLSPVPALLMPLAAGWAWGMRRMRQSCGSQPGWKRVLFDLHVTAFLGASPLLLTWIPFVGLGISGRLFREEWLLLAWLVSIPLMALAYLVGRRARARLQQMQRDVAVQVARRTLQTLLVTPHQRSGEF